MLHIHLTILISVRYLTKGQKMSLEDNSLNLVIVKASYTWCPCHQTNNSQALNGYVMSTTMWQCWAISRVQYLRIENECWIRVNAFLPTEHPVVLTVDGSNTNHSKQFTCNSSPLQQTISTAIARRTGLLQCSSNDNCYTTNLGLHIQTRYRTVKYAPMMAVLWEHIDGAATWWMLLEWNELQLRWCFSHFWYKGGFEMTSSMGFIISVIVSRACDREIDRQTNKSQHCLLTPGDIIKSQCQ